MCIYCRLIFGKMFRIKKSVSKNNIKELSFCYKLKLSNPYIFVSQCRRPLIFQTMNSVRSNNLNFKYQKFIPSGFKYIGNR